MVSVGNGQFGALPTNKWYAQAPRCAVGWFSPSTAQQLARSVYNVTEQRTIVNKNFTLFFQSCICVHSSKLCIECTSVHVLLCAQLVNCRMLQVIFRNVIHIRHCKHLFRCAFLRGTWGTPQSLFLRCTASTILWILYSYTNLTLMLFLFSAEPSFSRCCFVG